MKANLLSSFPVEGKLYTFRDQYSLAYSEIWNLVIYVEQRRLVAFSMVLCYWFVTICK